MSAATLPRLLTQREVCALLGVSRISLWAWRKAGKFPQPVVLGARTVRWPEPVVAKFVESRRAKG